MAKLEGDSEGLLRLIVAPFDSRNARIFYATVWEILVRLIELFGDCLYTRPLIL